MEKKQETNGEHIQSGEQLVNEQIMDSYYQGTAEDEKRRSK
ncbi:hypothetical protein J26TS2_15880 [Shouchella clausii]|nr:hypothetical protein [Shouchella tritolerans]GIN11721.1 hypothetical protein J26TS2_15880 [Shouchella clausii]